MKTFYLVLMTILIVIAIIFVLGGLAEANGAPQEAATAGIGCFIAILARIAQAAAHERK